MGKARPTGLIAAVPTPMRADYSLNLKPLELLADHLVQDGISAVYVGATAGEFPSLTLEERQRLAAWWAEVLCGKPLRLMVHVGHNCLTHARQLAVHAEKIGADAIVAVSPYYFKPGNAERLVACCETIAAAAPRLPFYLEEFPPWTGMQLPLAEFLALGRKRIPTLGGVICSSTDLAQCQHCLNVGEDDLKIIFGGEEALLAGLFLGAEAGVGSTLAFAGPIYSRMLKAYAEGNHLAARLEQARVAEVIETMRRYGFSVAAKAIMAMIGIDCGLPRLPLGPLSYPQITALRNDLERIEFFDWIGPHHAQARSPLPKRMAGLPPSEFREAA
jgi:N-acetylneuraminate lyase